MHPSSDSRAEPEIYSSSSPIQFAAPQGLFSLQVVEARDYGVIRLRNSVDDVLALCFHCWTRQVARCFDRVAYQPDANLGLLFASCFINSA
jgi:hypothetical protein